MAGESAWDRLGAKPLKPKPRTDIFTPNDSTIDRRHCTRQVPLEVLALGLGRTGTDSLRVALEHLGYASPYHMMTASTANPPDCLLWQAAIEAKMGGRGALLTRAHWDALLGHCGAATDWPVAFFAPELVAAYPAARVILTTRAVDAWHASVLAAGHWRATEPFLALVARLGDWGAAMYHPMLATAWSWYFRGSFDRHGKKVYAQHYAMVRRLVPEDRLLEFDVRQGWGPLCAFLGKEVPDIPFPHVNDSRQFRSRCMGRNWRQLGNVLVWWAAWVAGLAFVVQILRPGLVFARFPGDMATWPHHRPSDLL